MKRQERQSFSSNSPVFPANLFVCVHGPYVSERRRWKKENKKQKTRASRSQVNATGSARNGSRHYIGLFVFFVISTEGPWEQWLIAVEREMGWLKSLFKWIGEWKNRRRKDGLLGNSCPWIWPQNKKWRIRMRVFIGLFWFWCLCSIYCKSNALWSALISQGFWPTGVFWMYKMFNVTLYQIILSIKK